MRGVEYSVHHAAAVYWQQEQEQQILYERHSVLAHLAPLLALSCMTLSSGLELQACHASQHAPCSVSIKVHDSLLAKDIPCVLSLPNCITML